MTVFWAPAGALTDPGPGWTEIGYLAEGGLSYDAEPTVPVPPMFVGGSITVTFPLRTLAAGTFRLLFGRRHPRLRVMRCAYSRRLRSRRHRR